MHRRLSFSKQWGICYSRMTTSQMVTHQPILNEIESLNSIRLNNNEDFDITIFSSNIHERSTILGSEKDGREFRTQLREPQNSHLAQMKINNKQIVSCIRGDLKTSEKPSIPIQENLIQDCNSRGSYLISVRRST